MKTRFLPLFVVVAALALLAGFPQSGGCGAPATGTGTASRGGAGALLSAG